VTPESCLNARFISYNATTAKQNIILYYPSFESLHFPFLPTQNSNTKMDAQKMNRGTDAMKAHLAPTSAMEGT
jgi:hypothetical protein